MGIVGSSSDETSVGGRGLYFFGGSGFCSTSPQVSFVPVPFDAVLSDEIGSVSCHRVSLMHKGYRNPPI